jgi:hypothetical protein
MSISGSFLAASAGERTVGRIGWHGHTVERAGPPWRCEPEITLKGTDIAGIGVHIASRVMDHAPDDAIAVSSSVKDMTVSSSIRYEPMGSFRLKGVPDEWNLITVHCGPARREPDQVSTYRNVGCRLQTG